MKYKILKDKKESVQTLFLMQTFLVTSIIVYLGLIKWNLIDEQYHPITVNTILMILLLLNAIIGVASIYLYNIIVNLIEKEKEYQIQKIQIMQMEEVNDLLKSQKHDFSNNLQVLWGMLTLGNVDKALEYLDRYANTFKIDEEELGELKNICCPYLYTLLLNKAYICKDKGIEVYFNIQPSNKLEGYNPIDIVRILGNLLDNAIYEVSKLKDDGYAVIIDIFYDDENYIFQITNEGTVITEEIKNQIFKKGFSTKANEGSGYGLYNVKEIVKKYGGKIHIESNLDIGTRFEVILPKQKSKKSIKKNVS